MHGERLAYEVDVWHKAQGSRRTPDYWPEDATLCAIPQAHKLTTEIIKLKGQKVSLTVHHCTTCAFSLTEPTVATKGGKG